MKAEGGEDGEGKEVAWEGSSLVEWFLTGSEDGGGGAEAEAKDGEGRTARDIAGMCVGSGGGSGMDVATMCAGCRDREGAKCGCCRAVVVLSR